MKNENPNTWSLKRVERDVRDKGAPTYDASIGPVRRIVEPLAIFRYFRADASDSVLDVGAGTGRFIERLAESGCFVVGVDISRHSLMVAKKRCDCEVIMADLCHMPFKSHSFDKTMSVSVLQHLSPYARIRGLNEIKRVNRRGGKILLTIYNCTLWQFLRFQRKEGHHPEGSYFHRFNFTEVRALLESLCFQVESINGIVASDTLLRTQVLRKLNLSKREVTPRFLRAIVAIEKIIESITPLSFLFGDHLRVICRVPN